MKKGIERVYHYLARGMEPRMGRVGKLSCGGVVWVRVLD